MAKKFSELEAKMSPQSQARATAKANFMLQEMALAELRTAQKLTQEKIAQRLHRKQGGISRLEKQADMYVSTLSEYVRAVGGTLVITASFPSGDVRINQFSGSIGNSIGKKEVTNKRATSAAAAGSALSKKLSSKKAKSTAGSALTQRPNRRKKKK